jgi:hypothetical protein
MGLFGGSSSLRVLRQGLAARVIFFYPGEEGTYIDHAEVTLYENGIVHIRSAHEESSTHLQNCEILWAYELETADDRSQKVRLLKPKPGKESSKDFSKNRGDDPRSTPPSPSPEDP